MEQSVSNQTMVDMEYVWYAFNACVHPCTSMMLRLRMHATKSKTKLCETERSEDKTQKAGRDVAEQEGPNNTACLLV